jgi:DNA topoisomerase IA
MPRNMAMRNGNWKICLLFQSSFKLSLTGDAGLKKQFNIIKDLFAKATEIIVGTDAGREGELIFRYIYQVSGCNKPFKRLWISSQTDQAIRDGFNKLKAGTDYDNLYFAARSRSEADWLVGINATRALPFQPGQNRCYPWPGANTGTCHDLFPLSGAYQF